jgi:hypothetical protein
MRKIVLPLTVFATMLATMLNVLQAQAQSRVFVAAQGADTNPCTFVADATRPRA